MTSSPPAEAQHFGGNTLSPQSPVPVHIPEPQNIPVLQNQTDPTFNDMSTHMEQRYPSQTSLAMGIDALQHEYLTAMVPQTEESVDFDPSQNNGDTQEDADDAPDGEGGHAYALAYEGDTTERQHEPETLQNHLTTNAQQSMSNGVFESLSTPAKIPPTSFTPSQSHNPLASILQGITATSDSSQNTPVSHGLDAATHEPPRESDARSQASGLDVNGDDVNHRALLDDSSLSTSIAPTSDNITSITSTAPAGTLFRPDSAQAPIATLPVPAGLPPRPPPQEKPAIHPNYNPGEDIRSYHNPPAQNPSAPTSYNAQQNNSQRLPQGYVHNNGVAPNGLPPPPLATFQQPLPGANQPQRSPQSQQYRQRDSYGRDSGRPPLYSADGEDEHPRQPDVERLFEEFLRDEAIYVSEGTWDRFPQGSRLFVGNLFTEKATKRDIFYVFHKYGRLAQISTKSAYGFVQYHDANSCTRALQSEQGIEIRGRKIHLEISKPQKNTRNAAATAAGDNLRAGFNRRSRSPDYGRGAQVWTGGLRGGADRFDRNTVPNHSERRVRDDYRPMRSPSPRGFRGRDDFRGGRERSPDRYFRGRSRSPFDRTGQYRIRSPRMPDPDDEANLPIARRNPQDVPDVQMVLVDEVDRTFVGYIQQSFRDRSLRCDVLQLPRVSLTAVVKRQVVEGVQAVVKIIRKSQNTGKIPLQVYNRSAGVNNVRFDDYEDLDANVAAEIVFRAKTTHTAPAPAPPQYTPAPTYGASQYPHPHQPHQSHQLHQPMQPQQPQVGAAPANPNLANLITSLDGPALQKLLGAMSQSPQTPSNPQQPLPPQHTSGQQQDLSSLLQSVSRQQPQQAPQQGYQYGGGPPQQQSTYGPPAINAPYAHNPLANYGGRPPPQGYPVPPQQPPQQQQGQQHNVQDMLAQLARYKQ